ncbi:response regulator transcription factor [Suipraeoptans intestinalis]|nr:response regulator [Suipraeoptans intestinalis]MDD7770027.1 response regulator [Suipraeoptans intestinalis]MDY3121059.1 response regulator [Suipraeoptans intestinalis]
MKKLLKLVVVDDEPILLQGLLTTYDWEGMGFEVAGSAQSGEQALEVIRSIRPQVVLTDIRMKQMTGLMVMEEAKKEGIDSLFIVLSAYRDFEYAQQACDLGAYAYLLKPIEEKKLEETMTGAYQVCLRQIETEQKYESYEKILRKDETSFLQVLVEKYIYDLISEEKLEEVFETIGGVLEEKDGFLALCTDIDIADKIINAGEYEKRRRSFLEKLEEELNGDVFLRPFEGAEGGMVFLVKTQDNTMAHRLKSLTDRLRQEEGSRVVAAISKPYKGIRGLKKSTEEATKLFLKAGTAGGNDLRFLKAKEREEGSYLADAETRVVYSIRKNSQEDLKEAFVQFLYLLPREEHLQEQHLHKVMLKTELMIQGSYGMTEEVKEKFQSYYVNMKSLNAAKAVDVCYRILCESIEARKGMTQAEEPVQGKEYLADALAYIEANLKEEELSIVSVASHVYLNPVYFGRVFKNTFHMTFKKYLLQQRMEKAKQLLEEGGYSIGAICEQVGISNPSYFSHLFKQYTGSLPSEYKKEMKV